MTGVPRCAPPSLRGCGPPRYPHFAQQPRQRLPARRWPGPAIPLLEATLAACTLVLGDDHPTAKPVRGNLQALNEW